MNDEAGRAKFLSITDVVEVEGDVNWKTISTNLTGHDTKSLLSMRSKQRKAL